MSITITKLRCEGMDFPFGMDELRPRLSWILHTERRGAMQSAYEVLVATSTANLTPELAVWHTGRVESQQSLNLEYDGVALVSGQHYLWQVRIWDECGEVSDWSELGQWEMGLLEGRDWQAAWIEPEQQAVTAEPQVSLFEAMASQGRSLEELRQLPGHLHPCPHLRRVFELGSAVHLARLYVTARGLYRLECNGARVGNLELTPENTTYPKYQMYQTFDLTEHLQRGANALGFILSDGWYAGRSAAAGESRNFGERLAVLFQLEIELQDGSSLIIASDGLMRSSLRGPLIYSDLFIGERYDARLEMVGWSTPHFDDSAWDAVSVLSDGLENLVAQYGEPVRAVCELPVQQILHTPKGETVLDFGQVIAGRVRMRVHAAAANEITLEHSEVLDADGNFFRNIIWRNKEQTDIFVPRGDAEEVFEPRFSFHGFRYVRLGGYPSEVHAANFSAIVLGSDLEPAGDFVTSDPRLNRLQQNIVWSQRGNFLSIPTDCPQRERTGWTGDIQVFAPTAVFNRRVQAFLTRWLRLVQLEQLPNGEVPYHVPTTPSMAAPFGENSSAGWGDACLIVPWVLYQEYGDQRVLLENYQTMVGWVSYIERTAAAGFPEGLASTANLERQKYLWNTGFHFGDWLIPSIPNLIEAAHATKELVGTIFYAYSTRLLSEIAKKLEKPADAARYAALHHNICRAFTEEYLLSDGKLKAHFQGSYVLALHLGLIPEPRQAQVFSQLEQLIEANGYRLDTGFMSVAFLLDVLCKHGRADLAYRLLFQTECPSWLYAVEHGATTIWEAWDAIQPDGHVRPGSYNHYAFGCVGDWLYRALAGLERGAPGYKHSVIRPHFDCGLSWVRAWHETVYGRLESAWERHLNRIVLTVTIPTNTTARVCLPKASEIKLDGVLVQADHGELELGSGKYCIDLELLA